MSKQKFNRSKIEKEIASRITDLIKYQCAQQVDDENSYKDKFINIACEIKNAYSHAKALHDDCVTEGLTCGRIEAEGYLRCATHMLRVLESIDPREKE